MSDRYCNTANQNMTAAAYGYMMTQLTWTVVLPEKLIFHVGPLLVFYISLFCFL